eukprot:336318_1
MTMRYPHSQRHNNQRLLHDSILHIMALVVLEDSRKEALSNPKSNGWRYLQFLEEQSVSKPRDVVVIGKQLLDNNWISQNNRWRLLERVAISALELGDKQTAAIYIKELTAKFTLDSNRVRVLRGMFYETKKELQKANDEYDFVLKKDANHMMTLKRQIAMDESAKQPMEAIRRLCLYLKVYGSDRDAWKELTRLYLDMHAYEYAQFCIEELVTMNHDDYVLFQFYGETLYNIGGSRNYTTALKYFSQSLLLSCDKNTRSLWGVMMCIRAFKNSNDLSSDDVEMIKGCREKIMKNYVDSKSKLVQTVKDVLLTFDV